MALLSHSLLTWERFPHYTVVSWSWEIIPRYAATRPDTRNRGLVG